MGVFSDHENVLGALAELKGIDVHALRPELHGRTIDSVVVIETLLPYVSEERRRRIDDVLSDRTRTVVPVVEGIVNMGNVSAVMRTAEALGYQDMHIVTGSTRFKNSRRTSIGAEKWLDVYHWNSPLECARALQSAGYRVIATHLDSSASPIDEFDFTQKTAIVLGNERDGVSRELLDASDDRCILPMSGFAQSYNISVAAAIALYHAFQNRLQRRGSHGDLSEEERLDLRAAFYLRSVRGGVQILRRQLGAD